MDNTIFTDDINSDIYELTKDEITNLNNFLIGIIYLNVTSKKIISRASLRCLLSRIFQSFSKFFFIIYLSC